MTRRIALVAAGAAVGAAAIALFEGRDDAPATARPPAAVATATATARTMRLVDREDVDGRLGYAGRRTVGAPAAADGTLTRLAAEGTTVGRGDPLMALDGRPTAYVVYGRTPAWRALHRGVEDGDDVRQLERNLVALGHDRSGAMTVDEDFDAATAAAVRRWEDARGLAQDGVVERGEVLFTDGPARVGEHRLARGDRAAAGRPVTELTSRRRVVTARLPASRQALVRRGDRVQVTLPDGSAVAGAVTKVGRVARAGQDGAEATVALEVALRGRRGRRLPLDGAPVTVAVARTEARRALAVPVQALLATGAGRYAVEVVEGGRRRLVAVGAGAFGDGWVAVRGEGVRDGSRVVVPR